MDRILEQSDSRFLISNLLIVELESVLAIKMRTGEINQQSLETARRRFLVDLARQRLVAPSVSEGHFQSARNYSFDTVWRRAYGHSMRCN
jgi:hypothetical protein